MLFSKDTIPGSLRKQIDGGNLSAQRLAQKSNLRNSLAYQLGSKVIAKVDGLPIKKNFVRLPQEPEDAKLTGDTRSLDRRLLGLNLGGSLARRVQKLTA